jgi:hypothetical protein
MRFLTTLGLCAPLMFAQTKPPVGQVAGDCAVNIVGNNNSASLVCGNLDPKLAEQMKTILNSTRHNQTAIDTISKQLATIQAELEKPTLQIQQHSEGPNSPNTVNINQRPPARRIALERRAEIVAILARTPAKVKILAIMNNAEAFQFAQDWYDVFRDAGWTMTDKVVTVFEVVGQPDRGILVKYHGDTLGPGQRAHFGENTPADAVSRGFIALGVMDTVHGQGYTDLPENEFYFMVFERPEK